jgi:hypothetical protein
MAPFKPWAVRSGVSGAPPSDEGRSKGPISLHSAIEAFSAKPREETDLDALNDQLARVVRETMQPAHTSLWLRPDTASKGEQSE